MNRLLQLFIFLIPVISFAQKKPLDHTVYDSWQSIGERAISNDGKFVLYTVTPQEGDATLWIKATDTSGYALQVPRGYNAVITEDSRFAVFKIKPLYKQTRDARIKKKKPEDLPKDSFAVVKLGSDSVYKVARIKSYKTPKEGFGWVAYHKERDAATVRQSQLPTQKTVDSLQRTIDSLVLLVREVKNVKAGNRDEEDAEENPTPGSSIAEGSNLVLRRLSDGKEKIFKNISDYQFNEQGQKLVMRMSKTTTDTFSINGVLLYDLTSGQLDTIAKGGNDFKNLAITKDGSKVAFVAERDTVKGVQKYYGMYLYQSGADSAALWIDKHTLGMKAGMTISEHAPITFSKSGRRLLLGTAPIPTVKDTTLVDIDLVKLDIWHYNDDYLQTQQLFNLNNELKRSYMALFDFNQRQLHQLGSTALLNVLPTAEGDGRYFYAVTDTGRRVAAQWSGQTPKDVYAFDVNKGSFSLIKKNHQGFVYPSGTGKYLLLYDSKTKHYAVWDGIDLNTITSKIKVPLYNEEHDTPSDPAPYGLMGWHQQDSFVYVYDRYDVWKVDPENKKAPALLIAGRAQKNIYRYVKLDADEQFINTAKPLFFRMVNDQTKKSNLYFLLPNGNKWRWLTPFHENHYATLIKAKNANAFVYSKENYEESPNLFFAGMSKPLEEAISSDFKATQLTFLNPQQESYNWGSAELYKWKTFNGKQTAGVLYKPEDFDPAKKYPMIVYFYEKVTNNLYNYIAPSPTPSRLNISFFVSRGYLVFTPDISYTTGYPGKDAYNYIVSGVQSLMKNKWVDAKNIGLQGQSWGGYQVAHLITVTNMFKAAWAGAPVVNMTSAYGGIRWETGVTRQFQYEKGQSRLGVSLWQNPKLYIENSPLFQLPKVQTPLVIMSNDADGAVPWYQGIEMFTAMRRLNKKVWLLNYNGEAHNLVERKNRKDIQIREQQYFDWLLKGEKPARWLTEGVPATLKGKQWGLETVDEP